MSTIKIKGQKSFESGYVYAPYIPLQIYWDPKFVAVKEKLKNPELKYFQPQFISDFGISPSSEDDQFVAILSDWAGFKNPTQALDVFSIWFPIVP